MSSNEKSTEPYKPRIPTPEEYKQHQENRRLIEDLARILKVQGKGETLAERVREKALKLIEDTEKLKEQLGL